MTRRQSFWWGFTWGWIAFLIATVLVGTIEAGEAWPSIEEQPYHRAAVITWDMHKNGKAKNGKPKMSLGQGSGVLIEGGTVITAAHVVEGDTFEVMFLNGDTVTAAVTKRDDEKDIVFGKLEKVPEGAIAARLSTAKLEPGDVIEWVGFGPRKGETGIAHRWRSRAAWATNDDVIFSDCFAAPGDSGGPVFKDGEVVGVISGGWFWTNHNDQLVTWPARAYRP